MPMPWYDVAQSIRLQMITLSNNVRQGVEIASGVSWLNY